MEKLDPNGIENILPLTPMQEGMLFHYLKDPRSGLYFEQLSLEISGAIDIQVFEKAWNVIIQANEMLRTVFRWEKLEKPSQVILKEYPSQINFHDFSGLDDVQKKTSFEKVKNDDRDESFDLTRVPFRVILCKLAETQYGMIVSNHHILYDGWSNGIILKEFFNAYHSLSKGEQTLPIPAKSSFKEYVKWLQSRDRNKQEHYWRNYLADFETATELPIKRKKEETSGAGDYSITLGDDIQNKLDAFIKNNKVTLASVFYSAWGILLQRYCCSEDILFGTTVSGRSAKLKGIEDMVGLFINTIPLRINIYPCEMILNVVSQTDRLLREREEFEHTPLVDIGGRDVARNVSTLFDTIVVIENYPLDNHLIPEGSLLSIQSYSMVEATHYDLTVGIMPVKGIEIKFSFKQELFENDAIENLAVHFKTIIQKIIDQPETALSQLEIISSEEKNRILYEFNNTTVEYPRNKTIHQLFVEQAAKTPDYIAVIGHGLTKGEEKRRRREEEKNGSVESLRATSLQIQMSYRQLNDQSDCLADLLIEKGVLPDSIVGIMMERSIEMIIGIMSILKSGGAYLPIDPQYPQERINYMLKDSGAKLLAVAIGTEGEKLRSWEVEHRRLHHSSFIIYHSNLAYIIYTSGSTGNPKGVMVEHRNLINYAWWASQYYMKGEKLNFPLYTSISFDLTVTSVFLPLITGNSVILYGGLNTPMETIEDIINNNRIGIMKLTPAHLKIIKEITPRNTCTIKRFILGGEKLDSALASDIYKKFNGDIEIYNEYGPTEATVGCMIYRFSHKKDQRASVPIGAPVDNVKIYLMDKYSYPIAPGVVGEIYIGGDGIARGYLNRPELTAEKFRPLMPQMKNKNSALQADFHHSTFVIHRIQHSILYRTGDLARWLPDGNIEFLGRIDQQVKIRGFRIELEEIENRLLEHGQVKESVVLSSEDSVGDKYLAAYFVSDREIPYEELQVHLLKKLPDYMIPSYFVRLEKIPLTANGKIDRKALPDPKRNSLEDDMECMSPQSEVEKILVEIWAKILGREKVGINQNFFTIGGDSIKSLQIISRMSRAGYKMEMKDLFKYPVISKLAPRIKKLKRIPDQSAITGTIPLTPIQKAFFNESHRDPHHYNQAVMLYSREGFDKDALKNVFISIQEHHDVLRMTYNNGAEDGGEAIQVNHGLEYPFYLEEHDLINCENCLQELKTKADAIQGSIDLEKGPLMKLGLFHLEDGDRLLIAAHHLIIDGVSWRILLEDIETLYGQDIRGENLTFPLKTDSFKLWSEKLSAYANSKTLLKEKNYWQKIESIEVPLIAKDFTVDDNYIKDTVSVSFTLKEQETETLLTRVNEPFNTEINDILLTALGIAIRKTFGQDRVLMALEGHGREEILEDLDISRTVGWFTSIYPVVLDISYADHPGRQIKEIKETLRRIPNKGIGYGILRYLTHIENKKEITFKLKPQISFNYLGQFDTDIKEKSSFELAKESAGNSVGLNNRREYLLDVSGIITNNRLAMTIDYNKTHFKPETIVKLIGSFESELSNISTFCSPGKSTEKTPSDFTYKELSIDRLQQLLDVYPDVEDIYTLSPMQEGMLFHALMDKSSSSYFEQTAFRLHEELDIFLVEKSFNDLVNRHDILRTAFIQKDTPRAVQMVLKSRAVDFYYQDISQIGGQGEKEFFITGYKEKDKQRSFDLSKDVLMRVAVFRLNPAEYQFIWSHHHILMDGWCIGILNTEFFEIYTSYLENRPYRLPGVKPYRNYIQWLEKQDQEESVRYWENYLDSYEEQTGITRTKTQKLTKEENQTGYRNETVSIVLDMEKTAGLNKLAARSHVTLNTVAQTLWGILLGKYNGKDDVLFGIVVSGRPPGLEGIESMVGLFINTIPVRIRFESRMKLKTLLRETQEDALASEPHHYHPLAEIQSKSILKQKLIDHLFIFENYPIKEQLEICESEKNQNSRLSLKLTNVSVFEQTNYDFNIILQGMDRLNIIFQYNGSVYNKDFVEGISRHFGVAIDQVIENGELEVGELTFLSKEEKDRVLYEFNDTAADYPKDKTIHQLFAEQAARTPDAIALVARGLTKEEEKKRRREEEKNGGVETLRATSIQIQMSYSQLNIQSDQLAGLLIEKGVLPDTIVGIMMERSVEMIVGIMGILKAGGAYLPIDPRYPEERIDYMLKDSNTKILIINKSEARISKSRVQTNPNAPKINVPNNEFKDLMVLDFENLNFEFVSSFGFRISDLNSSNLAYVIYTSGTTGKPKGVLIEHKNVVRLLFNDRFQFDFNEQDVWSLFHSTSFDFSVWEMYGALLYGGMLVIIPRITTLDPGEFLQVLKKRQVTILNQTPSAFYNLAYEELRQSGTGLRIRYVIFGGEALKPSKLSEWQKKYPDTLLVNMFGITETTVHITYKEIKEYDMELSLSNIGKPIPTLSTYILDKNLKPVSIGVKGEIVVGGEGVARGYLNKPELSAEKFIHFHHSSFDIPCTHHSKLYRSGDTGRYLENGDIEYLGRNDQQIKIRGHRIELGEIESFLLQYEQIRDAAVIDKKNEEGESYLCAYIVPSSSQADSSIETSALQKYLARKMPSYMIPSYFVQVDNIPLTANGKVDRKTLDSNAKPLTTCSTYTAPQNELEKKIAEAWQEVLHLDKVSIYDNYFELGGTSFDIVKINRKLKDIFQIDVPIVDMFRYTTIHDFAAYLNKESQDIHDQSLALARGNRHKKERLQRLKGAKP